MMAELITSSANPVVKRMRLLAERRHRRREGSFVVQGIQPVWQAVEAGADIETLIVAPGLLGRSSAARGIAGMVAAQEAAGVRVARLGDELFGRLSDREGPPGLAAIVRGRGRRPCPIRAARTMPCSHRAAAGRRQPLAGRSTAAHPEPALIWVTRSRTSRGRASHPRGALLSSEAIRADRAPWSHTIPGRRPMPCSGISTARSAPCGRSASSVRPLTLPAGPGTPR